MVAVVAASLILIVSAAPKVNADADQAATARARDAAARANGLDSTGLVADTKDGTPAKVPHPADVFAGTGAWIDIFDDWSRPKEFTKNMARRHVATLYVQTSNSSQSYSIYDREQM